MRKNAIALFVVNVQQNLLSTVMRAQEQQRLRAAREILQLVTGERLQQRLSSQSSE
jgi:hypothetical protein